MAQLKIDIVVDDNGAAQKLQEVESAIKGVEAAAVKTASSAAAVGESFSKSLGSNLSKFGSELTSSLPFIISKLSTLQGMIGGFAFGAAVQETINFSGHLADMSAKTGASVVALQKLEAAGSLVGVSMDQIAAAMTMAQNRIASGSPQAIEGMKKLGLSAQALMDMSPDEMLMAMSEGMKRIPNQAEAVRAAMELMGRSGASMLPLLRSDIEGIGNAFERAGAIMTEEAVKAGDAWGDFQTIFGLTVRKTVADAIGLEKIGQAMKAFGSAGRFFSSAANPTAPSAPGMFAGGIGAGGQFTPGALDADRVTKELESEARRQFEEQKRQAEQAAKAWQKVNDQMTGKADADEAAIAIQHMKEIGGLTEMTAEQQEKLNKQLVAGMAYYKHLGESARAEMSSIITATMAGVAFTSGISPEEFKKIGQNMAPVDPQMLAHLMAPTVGVQNGISPEQFGSIGTQMALPTFQAVNPFRNAFEKLGQDLPDIIFRTIQGGGSVVGAVGAAVGAQFSKGFQGALEAVGGDVSKMSGGNKALGVAGASIGAAFTGFSLGQQLGKGKGAMAGAAAGALAGSVVPGIGTAIGAGVGALAGFFGGRSADKKAAQEMIQQREEWIKSMGGMEKLKATAADLGVNIDKAFSTKKPEEFRKTVESLNAAMEKQKNLTEGINAITAGTNARAANVTGQGDLNVVGAGAVASFGLQLGTGTSAVDALNALNPALVAMRDALAGGNFQMSEAGNKLLGLAAIVEAERVPFQNLAADGQILQGMMQGNIRDFDLFRAVATDIGTSLQGMIDRGVPTAQILTLAQPQLQALWEAQQKWHVEVDATTQGLLNQAVQQGTVGENMKSIQQQMLDATLGIRDAMVAIAVSMGALPAAAMNAANGMNAAFGSVQPPPLPGPWTPSPSDPGTPIDMPTQPGGWQGNPNSLIYNPYADPYSPLYVPGSAPDGARFASGGVVRARPGGTLIRVGEAGQDEAITPLNRRGRGGAGGGVTVVVNVEGSLVHQDDLDVVVAQAWSRAVRSNKSGSYTMAQAALGNA